MEQHVLSTIDDGYPDDWMPPPPRIEDDGPDDWIPSAESSGDSPAGTAPQPDPFNRPPPPPDPFAAYFSMIPASSLTAFAWAPPVFPDQFWKPPPPPPLTLPLELGSGGLLGGIAKMLGDKAAANDPWTIARNSIVGGLADLGGFGQGGILGGLAHLQPSSNASFALPPITSTGGTYPGSWAGSTAGTQPVAPSLPSLVNPIGDVSGTSSQPATTVGQNPWLYWPSIAGEFGGNPAIEKTAGEEEEAGPDELFDPLAPVRVDLYNTARGNLQRIQPGNEVLREQSLRSLGSAPTWKEIGELDYEYRIAQITQPLADTAGRIAKLVEPFAQGFRTISVLQTTRGTLIAVSGGTELEEDQVKAITALGATPIEKAGVVAEIAALNSARDAGALPRYIAASRRFCPACREEIKARGGYITSPNTAVFSRNTLSVTPLR